MRIVIGWLIWIVWVSEAVADVPYDRTITTSSLSKINFDSSQLSDAGLIGKPDGLRSLMYEFCIPATAAALAKTQSIDPTLTYTRSPGRIRCKPDQYLVIGNTYKPNWQYILTQLTQLDYVERVDQFWGE